jgi:hypothetical protein
MVAQALGVHAMPLWLEDNVDLGDLLLGDHAGARPEIAAVEPDVHQSAYPRGSRLARRRLHDPRLDVGFAVRTFF